MGDRPTCQTGTNGNRAVATEDGGPGKGVEFGGGIDSVRDE